MEKNDKECVYTHTHTHTHMCVSVSVVPESFCSTSETNTMLQIILQKSGYRNYAAVVEH